MSAGTSPEHFTYAIIGGGIAGVTCAEHLEIVDGCRKVVLVSGSPLIKAVTNVLHITNTIDTFDVEDRPAQHLSKECPSLTVKQATVTKLDHKQKLLHLSSGEVLSYDRVCVCTGALPRQVFPGHPHVVYIRDTESVVNFQKRLQGARKIVIVGNGGIATEMVYELSGLEVVWTVKDPWFTAAFIDPGAAEFFRPDLTKDKPAPLDTISKRRKYTIDDQKVVGSCTGGALGPDWLGGLEVSAGPRSVRLVTGVEVNALLTPQQYSQRPDATASSSSPSWPVYVELSNGQLEGCDFVVCAAGVIPNTALLAESGEFKLSAEGGLLVGEDLQTSVPGVYAAGDIISPTWELAKHWHQMRLWTQARQMGSYAAKSMWAAEVGEVIYQDFCFELFTHATKFFGHKVVMLGLYNGQKLDGKYDILLRMTRGMEYIKVVMKEGLMQGALLIGDTDLEETFENLILNQMDLSSYGEHLLDPDIDIEDYFD